MLDHALAILLIAFIPARALWRDRPGRRPSASRSRRYLVTIAMVAALLALLAVDWIVTGRGVASLGLSVPTTASALIGLGLAVALMTALLVGTLLRPVAASADAERKAREMLPATPAELRLYLLLAVAVGFGWEVLYRGFLLFYLQPLAGLPLAVAIAALAYAAAHGFQTARRFAASLASALAFTVGYAVTGNLWWLVLIHAGLPLVGALAGRRLGRVSTAD